jgi:hypothetical protein
MRAALFSEQRPATISPRGKCGRARIVFRGLVKLPLLLASGLCLSAMHSAAESAPERWQSPSADFTVVFSGKPKVSQVEGDPAKGTAHLDIAAFRRPDGFERVEASANLRTKPMTKGEAMQIGEGWAKLLNVADAKMSFDEFTPNDKKLTVKGAMMFGGMPKSMIAVFHWGKKTNLLVWVAESPDVFPTPAGSRFLASVHQSWP